MFSRVFLLALATLLALVAFGCGRAGTHSRPESCY